MTDNELFDLLAKIRDLALTASHPSSDAPARPAIYFALGKIAAICVTLIEAEEIN